MTRIGIITGMRDEAALLPADDGVAVYCEGPGTEGARRAAERALADGATSLLSFGLAVGLDPALSPGALIVAEAVVTADGSRRETDAAWRARVAARFGSAKVAALAETGAPVASVADKRRLFQATGAVAADMESGAVARVAGEAGVPFLALRVVADPAGRAIPPAALAGLRPDGTTDSGAVMRAVATRPKDLPGLVRLAGDYHRAQRALRDVAFRIAGGAGLA